MGSSILSKAEIDALLHAGSSHSIDQGLVDILTRITENMATWLKHSLGQNVEIDGPYTERVTQGLEQVVSDDFFIQAATVGGCELLLFLSVADAQILGSKLGRTADEVTELLGQVWMEQLGNILSVDYTMGKAQRFVPGSLEKTSLENHPYLIRHLIRIEGGGFEFSILAQENQIKGLASAKKSVAKPVPLETQKLIAQGRLLKGSISPVSEASFSPIEVPEQDSNDHSISLLEDISLLVTVELGQTSLTLNEILELKPQSVITLNRHAGEPVDVHVNNKRLARGEVVVLEENFGVRILEIIPQSERIED